MLGRQYDFDDFFNGWFVTTQFLTPMLGSLCTIQEESLKKKAEASQPLTYLIGGYALQADSPAIPY